MIIKQLTLLALMATPFFAQATESSKVTPLVVLSEEDRPLNAAERTYILTILAQSVELFADNFHDQIDPEAPDSLRKAVTRELQRTKVSLDDLSEEQRTYLQQERGIQENAVKSMEGKNDDMQKEIFQTMQQSLESFHKSATPHMKRLFGTHTLFDNLVIEVEFDAKLRAILESGPVPSKTKTPASEETIKKLKAFAAELRSKCS